MPVNPERTTFSLDVLGRYLANTWQEAMDSADASRRPDARPFDVVVIGGGTFGAAFAQHLFASDTTHSYRILLLEAGPELRVGMQKRNRRVEARRKHFSGATPCADVRE